MAFTNKTIASTYGDILQADNNGSGRTANGTNIKDGLGQSTALTLGQNKLHVKPSSDQTDAMIVETSGGTDLLTVDTTNSAVKLGTTQSYANTQIQKFIALDIQPSDGTHHGMFIDGAINAALTPLTFGTGTDPKVEETVRNTIDKLASEGAIIEEINIESIKYSLAAYYIIAMSEASSNLAKERGF